METQREMGIPKSKTSGAPMVDLGMFGSKAEVQTPPIPSVHLRQKGHAGEIQRILTHLHGLCLATW